MRSRIVRCLGASLIVVFLIKTSLVFMTLQMANSSLNTTVIEEKHYGNAWEYIDYDSPRNCLQERCPEFSKFTDFTEEEYMAINGGPFNYLHNFSNPCWYANFPENGDTPYTRNPYFNQGQSSKWNSFSLFMHHRAEKGETKRLRCLPLIYLVGVTKSGTSDLYNNIITHEKIYEPMMKEPMWWNRNTIGRPGKDTHFTPTFSHYVDLFDVAALRIESNYDEQSKQHSMLTIDATPAYLWDYDGWEKIRGNEGLSEPKYILAHAIRELVPHAKIITILRDPTERLYSQFRMQQPKGTVKEFHTEVIKAIDAFKKCLQQHSVRHCTYKRATSNKWKELFLRASLYSVYIEDWLGVFSRNQMLILKAEDYYDDRKSVLEQVFKFLELDSPSEAVWQTIIHRKVRNSKTDAHRLPDKMLNSTHQVLDSFFSTFNERLAKILGDSRFLWK